MGPGGGWWWGREAGDQRKEAGGEPSRSDRSARLKGNYGRGPQGRSRKRYLPPPASPGQRARCPGSMVYLNPMRPWIPFAALALALSPLLVVHPVRVSGHSMEPALAEGDLRWALRAWASSAPRR